MKNIIITIIITIIVGIIALLYAFGILFAMLETNGPFLLMGIVCIALLGIIFALIYNMVKRVKEIREEDKDDLSKY
ncbi:hypothetical protein [Marinisporobacter balticus]|uniref:Uncharacterized protein n=1 Tax=Marinisporobacter balticus TaxID=2018667 RepID=A0A4R2KUJ7_9FIRM|nr:hypothetical protein [Marinisporobacter balticus]TCO74806.1 hypothetical protein EV214_11169 [Marinisporobacter balticus]